MAKLFEDISEPSLPAVSGTVGVAVATNVWSVYDYAWPAGWAAPRVGQRIRVPFGRTRDTQLGFVVRLGGLETSRALKPVAELLDEQPQLDAELMALAQWIAHYYLTPLGMVLAAMIPSTVGRHASRTETVVYLATDSATWPAQLGPKQRRLLDELLESRKMGSEPVVLERLLQHSGATRESIRRLLERQLVRTETRKVVLAGLESQVEPDPFEVNPEQRQAIDTIVGRIGQGFSPILLHGVTGSGKTEVYVHAIRAAVAAGGQAILLAPEIALATQTLDRLLKRMPRVAVLHSGLTSAQRAFYYEQIRDGHASVVVGPRSAVFAPTRKLALIIVDEEHEGSYKQDTAPRYHARDVAIKRGQLAGVPVILGSATPSLESYNNFQRGRYQLIQLPRRVRGLPMPKLQLVHLRKDLPAGKVALIGKTMTSHIAATLDREEQIILLMNRRGYASYVFCPSCQWIMECDNCSRPMVYHQAVQLGVCHYCQKTSPLPEHCPACKKKLLLFGMGIQRIEDELMQKFPTARVARMDSDTMTTSAQFAKLLADFRSGEVDILLGTQMVAKGLDFPRVSLVGVVSADTSLAIPDFRSAERTFQLIVQVAGRAGRAHEGGEVIVQTLHAEEPAIQKAVSHDYYGFVNGELPLREELHLPPFSRMVRLLVRHEGAIKCEEAAAKLAERLREIFPPQSNVRMMGPSTAPVVRIRNQFRWHILLTSDRPGEIQTRLAGLMEQLSKDIGAELIADVDPVTLA